MIKTMPTGLRWLLLVMLLLSVPWVHAAKQQIILEAGWNLISVQVVDLDGWSMAEIEARLDIPNALEQITPYCPDEDIQWPRYLPKQAGFPQDIDELEPGKGYWAKVSEGCVLELEGEPWDGSVELRAGWNLVGFPGIKSSHEFSSIFREKFDRIHQIWTFSNDPSQSMVGYDTTSVPRREELSRIEPGRGYLIEAHEAISLGADPEVMLSGDFDLPPLQDEEVYSGTNSTYIGRLVRYAGTEDHDAGVDLNQNGILDDPWTQDTLVFREGIDQQIIVLVNRAAGLMNWSVEEDVEWLSVEKASGSIASEKEYVVLRVDRSGLLAGRYEGALALRGGTLIKRIRLLLDVSTIAGDYKGYASPTRVNGRNIGLGKVDLTLSMFMESEQVNEPRFRAVINRDESLLFPRDIFANGILYHGNDFSLTTSFEMPPGDRNAPPYDTFSHVSPDPQGVADKDYNGDGVLDVDNPFPYAVRREISLLGTRVTANRLEGTYVEAIGNMLPNQENIYIEGTFVLDRRSFSPSRRSIYNQRNDEVELIGGSGSDHFIEKVISVADAVSIQDVEVFLDMEFPDPELLTISLESPAGTYVTLHQQGSDLAPNYLLDDFNEEIGQGEWTLRIEWDASTGERGLFHAWNLDLEGLSFYSISGRILAADGGVTNPLPQAQIILSGSNLIEQDLSGAAGQFDFSALTENEYVLSISCLGYEAQSIPVSIDAGNVVLGDVVLSPIAVTQPVMIIQPALGYTPLQVSCRVIAPLDLMTTTVGTQSSNHWDFGDGTESTGGANVQHLYAESGHFTPIVTISGALGTLSITGRTVVAQSVLPNPALFTNTLPLYITGGGFVAGGAGSGTDTQSQRDSAAFDLNRWPTNRFTHAEEDSDFFVQENTPYHALSTEPIDSIYEIYEQPEVAPDRFRIISTIGGCVMGKEPARVGGFRLQSGRVEP